MILPFKISDQDFFIFQLMISLAKTFLAISLFLFLSIFGLSYLKIRLLLFFLVFAINSNMELPQSKMLYINIKAILAFSKTRVFIILNIITTCIFASTIKSIT